MKDSLLVVSVFFKVIEVINSSVLSLVLEDVSDEKEFSLDSIYGSDSFTNSYGNYSFRHILIGFLLFDKGIGSSLFIHPFTIYFFISSSAAKLSSVYLRLIPNFVSLQ